MTEMSVLVTGACGEIGQALAQGLLWGMSADVEIQTE